MDDAISDERELIAELLATVRDYAVLLDTVGTQFAPYPDELRGVAALITKAETFQGRAW